MLSKSLGIPVIYENQKSGFEIMQYVPLEVMITDKVINANRDGITTFIHLSIESVTLCLTLT
ncbi:MAG: hypothetical protein II574_08860 [Ruminococcus sp.]|nr:hypothetical protein [Ruminococcus sp.]